MALAFVAGARTQPRLLFLYALRSQVLVPYDRDGRKVEAGGRMMWWDLQRGAEVKITPGHNIQGARQPAFMHIGSSKPKGFKRKNGKICGPGHGRVLCKDVRSCNFQVNIEGANMR